MERYTRVFSLPSTLYAEGSLVILEAGALLKDNANNTMLAQLKFKNVNPKAIKMLKVEIISKDSMGRDLEPATAYQYLDLHVYRNDSFGSQQAIALPDNTVRSFEIKVLEIGLEDNSIVKGAEAKWEALPNPTKLDDSELSKQCQIAYGNDFRYEAAEFSDLWYCACGALNRKNEMTCYRCSRPFKRLSASDIQELTAAMEQRFAEEKHQWELAEQKRREEEAKAEQIRKIKEAEAAVKRKKFIKMSALAGAAMAVVAAIFLLVTKVVIPNQQYNSAVALMDAGRYEEAIRAFEAMAGYKDSKEQITICRDALKDVDYNNAVTLMNDGRYEEAIAAFTAMHGYRDSADQISACQAGLKDIEYDAAVALINEGKIIDAYEQFIALNGYKDSTNIINEITCKYHFEKIRIANVGDTVIWGSYEQDNETSNGKEPIEWLVLGVGNKKVLLLSKYGLDAQPYNENNVDIVWEKCSIRHWLNNSFINNAFTSEEKDVIALSDIDNSVNQGFNGFNTEPGNNTQDKVFLFSYSEVVSFLNGKEGLQISPTEYAKANGAVVANLKEHIGSDALGIWWLRSPGPAQNSAIAVDYSGAVNCYVDEKGVSVRPAMWISLE